LLRGGGTGGKVHRQKVQPKEEEEGKFIWEGREKGERRQSKKSTEGTHETMAKLRKDEVVSLKEKERKIGNTIDQKKKKRVVGLGGRTLILSQKERVGSSVNIGGNMGRGGGKGGLC